MAWDSKGEPAPWWSFTKVICSKITTLPPRSPDHTHGLWIQVNWASACPTFTARTDLSTSSHSHHGSWQPSHDLLTFKPNTQASTLHSQHHTHHCRITSPMSRPSPIQRHFPPTTSAVPAVASQIKECHQLTDTLGSRSPWLCTKWQSWRTCKRSSSQELESP